MIGSTIGVFQIIGKLGEGGMGEVYRARDLKLSRDVAFKVLRSAVSGDPERLARLAREARLLASVNHVNIATIHGLEESDGVTALVMELIEGPTLAEKLDSGARAGRRLPLAEALAIAAQIAQALEIAHDQGIVHRDLKPANLKVNADGLVKVLDFGLATGTAAPVATGLSLAPTLTAVDPHGSAIVGTPAYMSPEQARGFPTDARADIWAFGCIVFEMIAGRRPFAGATMSDTFAAILEREPDWSALPAATPPALRSVIARCLEKDTSRRWRNIADVRIAVDDGMREVPADRVQRAGIGWRERTVWAAFATAAVATAAVVLVERGWTRAPLAPEIRFDAAYPTEVVADFAQFGVSPDGLQIVAAPGFGGPGSGRLWLRPIGSTSGRLLPGTEAATFPFWSFDGTAVGFFADRKLKRIDVKSEAIEILADAPLARGGAWLPDGTIVFAPNAIGPLSRVPSTGGTASALTHLEKGQNDHRAPFLLPGARHFLYYARGDAQKRGVYAARIDGTEPRRLLDADGAAVYTSGSLLFVRQGDLYGQPFDPVRLQLTGDPFRVASRIPINLGLSLASLAASLSGTVAYSAGTIRQTQFTWFDRSGKRLNTIGPADLTGLAAPALSPDGRRVAFGRVIAGNWDIWLMDLEGTLSRLTTDTSLDMSPIWSREGRRVFYQLGNSTIRANTVNEAASETIISGRPNMVLPSDVSPDGRFLLYTVGTTTSYDLWYVALEGDRTPHPFVETPFIERDGQFSPDGRWVAYQSNVSGRSEIYLQPFPGPGERIQVSSGGGQQPRWSPRTSELLYIAADQRLTAVPVTGRPDGSVTLGSAAPLFRIEIDSSFQVRQQYDVSPDGQRFLVNSPTAAVVPPAVSVILNWTGKPDR